jgi:pyruvate/2-oxoglutarate dehydrogenase complex dihydrolipoamide acyltransferase (E2) component
MLFARVFICSLITVAGAAQAQQQPAPEPEARAAQNADSNRYQPANLDMPNQAEEARPVQRHRGLKIALGVVGGVVLIGAIVAIGVVNASSGSSNQTGYNDWGMLAIMRR